LVAFDTRRPLRQFAIGPAAFQTSTLDRSEGIVGKLGVKSSGYRHCSVAWER
jgi:hypothetical protein